MPVSRAEYELLAEFRHALRGFVAFSEAEAKSMGLSPRQHQALLAIRGFPGPEAITIGQLAKRLFIKHNSAVGLVDRLVADGLVSRAEQADDHRRVVISMSERGLALLERLASAHRSELRRIGPHLRELISFLER